MSLLVLKLIFAFVHNNATYETFHVVMYVLYHLTIDQTMKYELCTSNYDSDANDLRCHVIGRSHENREQKPLFYRNVVGVVF